MKLSEAIRLGAMIRPQGFGKRHAPDGSTCVLGAIEDAVGGWGAEPSFPILDEEFTHPVTGDTQPLGYILAGLNNRGGEYFHDGVNPEKAWTRERIADWVETIEPQETPQELVDGILASPGAEDFLTKVGFGPADVALLMDGAR